MEVKDFNIFNLSLQQKKLLKKKIGQSDESINEGLAVFFVDVDTSDAQNPKYVFTLKQGTPEFITIQTSVDVETQVLRALFVVNPLQKTDVFISSEDIVLKVYIEGATASVTWTRDNTDLVNFKPGDSFSLNIYDGQEDTIPDAGGNDVPIFYVEDSTDLTFTLVQGKPKIDTYGDLQPIICIDRFQNLNIMFAVILFDSFYFTKLNVNTFSKYEYSNNNKSYVNDFLALNAGESLVISKSELTRKIKLNSYILPANKNFESKYSFDYNTLMTLSISYESGNDVYMNGRVTKIDQTNHNLYLSIGDEVWKYTYTSDGVEPFSNITFVEVVQP